jgi:hypothetical protein
MTGSTPAHGIVQRLRPANNLSITTRRLVGAVVVLLLSPPSFAAGPAPTDLPAIAATAPGHLGRLHRAAGASAKMRHAPLARVLPGTTPAGLAVGRPPTELRIVNAPVPGLASAGAVNPEAVPRIHGATVTVAPVPRWSRELAFSGGYYALGRGAPLAGDEGAQRRPLGQAWAVNADSLLLGRRLRVRGEYVRSVLRSGAPEAGMAHAGSAYDVGVAYWIPGGGAGAGGDWNLEFHHARIGADFWSPGNASLPRDVALWQADLSHQVNKVKMRLGLSRRRSNLDNRTGLSRSRDDRYQVHLSSPLDILPRSLDWLGRLVGTLTMHSEALRDSITGSHTSRGGRVGVNLRPKAVALRITSGWERSDQRGDPACAATSLARSYGLSMTVAGPHGIRVSPRYSFTTTVGTGAIPDSLTRSGSVAMRVPLSRGRAAFTFDANIRDTSADNVSGDFRQSLVNTGFVWKMSRPHGWHPGVDVNLTQSLQWTRAGGDSGGVADWRLLAGVRIAYGN